VKRIECKYQKHSHPSECCAKNHQMGNCINGVSLAVQTFSNQINEGGQREIELCLSFGATGWESVERLAKEAISTGITPMINSLNVIGLISIPGMVSTYIFCE
jgi:putative ABC transport system permease protein